MMGLKPFEQIGNNAAFQPSLPADRDQDRAMESPPEPAPFKFPASGAIPRETVHQEGTLVHIPDSAVANHGGEAVVESDAARHKGRPRAVAENGYPVFINIVPRRQVIHHAAYRQFQIEMTDHFVEIGAGAGTEEIHGQQRHSAFAGMTRHLEEIFLLPMSG